MKRSSIVRALGLLFASVLVAGCSGGGGDGSGSEGAQGLTLAEVGDRVITSEDFRAAALAGQGLPPVTPEERRLFLDDLINKELMEIAAYEAYPEPPIQHGWRLARVKKTLLEKKLRERLIMDQIVITEEMKDQLYAHSKRELRVWGILVQDGDEAKYVRSRLDAGDDFASLADDHSMKWTGNDQGGAMGWLTAGTLPWPVDSLLWASPLGTVVGPIAMADGHYIVQAREERDGPPLGTRELQDEILRQKLLEPLYMDQQISMLDSLHAHEEPFVSAEARQLLQSKYYWEPKTDNPMEYLEAERFKPSFTPEESALVVIDFKHAPDWTADEFAERLTWIATGIWPRGHSDEQLQDCLDLMIRDFLINKAALDYGVDQLPEVVSALESREREMRVTYFYYNNILAHAEPTQAEIDAYFEQFRDQYVAAPSYKVAVFTSEDKAMLEELAKEWRAGAAFKDLRDRYEARDPELKSMGESVWIYEGQDPGADDVLSTLVEGGVSDPDVRVDRATVYRLLARRGSRPMSYNEIKEQVDENAKVWIQDQKLKRFLEDQKAKVGVTVHEEALAQVSLEEAL